MCGDAKCSGGVTLKNVILYHIKLFKIVFCYSGGVTLKMFYSASFSAYLHCIFCHFGYGVQVQE